MSRIAKERLRCRHCLARIAGPISFPLPRGDAAGDGGVRFGPDECVAVSSQGPVYATTSSHNASCEMHRLAASERAAVTVTPTRARSSRTLGDSWHFGLCSALS